MKHSFLDKYSDLDSPVHRLDARLRLTGALAAILIMVSVPRGQLEPFLFYVLFIVGLVWLSRVPPRFIISRCLVVAPFILISAAMFPISSLWGIKSPGTMTMHGQIMVALSIMLKAFLSVVMVTLLVSTGRLHDLLHGMRRMKAPRLVGVLSAMMYRYIFIIYDETLRTCRARESRTPGKLVAGKLKTFGSQASMIFLRSWKRSQTIHHAMLSRGFTGEFPARQKQPLHLTGVLLTILFIVLFLVARIGALWI